MIALVAAIVYGSLLVAVYGFLGMVLNRDVITERDAGVLIGPAMVVVASIVVFIAVLRGSARRRTGRRLPVARATVSALAVYLIGPAIGGMLYGIGRSEPFVAITFFLHYTGTPFILASAGVAFLVVLLAPFLDRPGFR